MLPSVVNVYHFSEIAIYHVHLRKEEGGGKKSSPRVSGASGAGGREAPSQAIMGGLPTTPGYSPPQALPGEAYAKTG